MDFEVQEVVVVADELSDLAVDVCGQLLGIGVGAEDQLGADLHDVSPHGSGPAWPTVAGVTGPPGSSQFSASSSKKIKSMLERSRRVE